MEPITPFTSPYATGPPSCHHGGHFNPSFFDDSGYASEDSDSTSFVLLDPEKSHGDSDQFDYNLPWTGRRRAAGFVNAQWSQPVVFRACRPFYDSLNESGETYDLPQPLPFEQQRSSYDSGSRLKPKTSCNGDRFGHHTTSRRGFEENVSPLDSEEHRTRVADARPSLGNRIETEIDHSSRPLGSIRQCSPSPEIRLQPGNSTTFAQPDHRADNLMPSSAQRPCQHQSPSPDVQLTNARQQLYQERMQLEKDMRALEKKTKSLRQGKQRRRSSRRDSSDGMAGDDNRSENHVPDGMAEGDGVAEW